MNRNLLTELILSELAKWKKEKAPFSPEERIKRWKDVPNVFFHFTKGFNDPATGKTIVQLSVNPKTTFNTPFGIYGYPSDQVFHIADKEIPYGGGLPYIIFFKAVHPDKLLYLDDTEESYSPEQFKADIIKLIQLYGNNVVPSQIQYKVGLLSEVEFLSKYRREQANLGKMKPEISLEDVKNIWDYTEKANVVDGPYFNGKERTFATRSSIIWNLTRENVANNDPKKWRKVLLSLGYEGVVDPGYGIIHPNEPYQAVFFSEGFVSTLDYVPNPTIDRSLKTEYFLEKIEALRIELTSMLKNAVHEHLKGVKMDPQATQVLHFLHDYKNEVSFRPAIVLNDVVVSDAIEEKNVSPSKMNALQTMEKRQTEVTNKAKQAMESFLKAAQKRYGDRIKLDYDEIDGGLTYQAENKVIEFKFLDKNKPEKGWEATYRISVWADMTYFYKGAWD